MTATYSLYKNKINFNLSFATKINSLYTMKHGYEHGHWTLTPLII